MENYMFKKDSVERGKPEPDKDEKNLTAMKYIIIPF